MVPWTGAFLILVASLFRRDSARRREDFVTVMGYAVFVLLGTQLSVVLVRLLPQTYDPAFLALDRRLGFDTLAVAAAVARHPLLFVTVLLGYVLMPSVVGLAWVLEQDLTMRRAVLLGGSLCFLFYWLLPAVGPAWYDFVRQVPRMAPRNAMPSMHLTWALLIAIYARGRALQIALWTYAGLIAVATIALGEHYLIDLIAAIPYTIAVHYAATNIRIGSLLRQSGSYVISRLNSPFRVPNHQ